MVHLLDVNVLVALFDPEHINHEAAHTWFAANLGSGWATCPLTENGLVRILSNPAYPGRRTTVADAVGRLRQFTQSGGHTFWAHEVSILTPASVDTPHLTGHRQVTDTYLLALAVIREGALATFDRTMRPTAAVGASDDHLVVIPANP